MQTINSPSQLQAFATQTTTSASKTPLRIHLLFPLRDPDILTLCRNPDSRYLRDGEGRRLRPWKHETISLAPLAVQWREAWKHLSADAVDTIAFDISLPELGGPEGSVTQNWDGYWTDEQGYELNVPPMEVLRMVILLATTLRMRNPTSPFQFGLNWRTSDTTEKRDSNLKMLRYLQGLGRLVRT